MDERAKLFKSGGSQAVRLPRRYRFVGALEVRIHREGTRVVLEPVRRKWSKQFLELAGTAPDFRLPAEPHGADSAPDLD